jgi:hypothetical protein
VPIKVAAGGRKVSNISVEVSLEEQHCLEPY